jgi:adenine-specific DNA glycosylase
MNQRILELAKDNAKVVMRIERDQIWVDPDVSVTETAQLVLDTLAAQIGLMVNRAHQDGQRAMRERAAKVGSSYEPRCDSCPSGIECAIRNLEIEP